MPPATHHRTPRGAQPAVPRVDAARATGRRPARRCSRATQVDHGAAEQRRVAHARWERRPAPLAQAAGDRRPGVLGLTAEPSCRALDQPRPAQLGANAARRHRAAAHPRLFSMITRRAYSADAVAASISREPGTAERAVLEHVGTQDVQLVRVRPAGDVAAGRRSRGDPRERAPSGMPPTARRRPSGTRPPCRRPCAGSRWARRSRVRSSE